MVKITVSKLQRYPVTLAESLKAGGIDATTLDLIMNGYMYRINQTERMLATGLQDESIMEIVWEEFFQEIARLGSPGLMDHLNQTLHELGFEQGWAKHAEVIPSEVSAVEAMEQDQPLDLSLVPPRFWC